MGNAQSDNQYKYKNTIDEKIIQQRLMENQLQYYQKNRKRSNDKNKNHIMNNPEVQNTLLKNKTMQRKLAHYINNLSDQQKRELSDKNYSSVNKFLHNLNIYDYEDYENKNDALYMNQGENAVDNIEYEKDFIEQEKELERKFRRKEMQKREIFKRQQKERRQQYKEVINQFNNSSVDPYHLFKLNKNFTEKDLKESYKKLAMVTHPDRPRGSSAKFQIVTKAYMSLLEDLKKREVDKSFLKMRDESSEYIDLQRNENYQNKDINMNGEKFDINNFNKIYESNRLDIATDTGYEKWMKENAYKSDDIQKNDLFSDKFNINIFNTVFSDKSKKQSNQIIKYEVPMALNSGKLKSSDLGINNIDNFSGDSNNLSFTDYKEAYTNCFIDPQMVNYKKYKDVNELKQSRSKIKKYSQEELDSVMRRKKLEEEKEEDRKVNLRQQDNISFEKYRKIHNMFIKN
jgi:curved DNA-binding protein CbpA